MGGGAGSPGPEGGEQATRDPLLGRVRGLIRRARQTSGRVDGQAPARRAARRRHPRSARVMHRRSGEAHGQRVRVPVVRGAERLDAERGRRDEDRRQLPALLQHARERVPGLRRPVRGRPPHGAPRRSRQARQAQAGGFGRVGHVPRLLLPRAAQRRHRRAARPGGRGRKAGRDGAKRQAHVLLRGRWRAHVDGGTREGDQRGARARGGRDRRRDAGRRLPLLHDHARRRRPPDRARPARRRRLDLCSSRLSTARDPLPLRPRDRRRRLRGLRHRKPPER